MRTGSDPLLPWQPCRPSSLAETTAQARPSRTRPASWSRSRPSGDALDPDGYTVTLNGESARQLMINDTTVYEELPYGEYTVLLDRIAGNCTVNQNPWTFTAVTNAVNEAPFGVACLAP